jgi:hypothetical protein
MSTPTYRYQLSSCGAPLGRYKTLGQALLGATWRARKRRAAVWVYAISPRKPDRWLATVVAARPD